MPRTLVLALVALLTASATYAQTPYIGASANADVVRFSGAADELFDFNGDGEAFGWSVRAGVPLGERWGIDAEFVRGGKVKSDASFPVDFPEPLFPPSSVTGVPGNLGLITLLPSSLDFSRRERFSTLSTTAWFRQDVTSRFALVYLGGLAFVRAEREVTLPSFSFACAGGLGIPTVCNDTIEPTIDRGVSYSAAPTVGIDAKIGLNDRLSIVPGLRLLIVDPDGQRGLMTRPSLGMQWTF
jgi:hypothetical protein